MNPKKYTCCPKCFVLGAREVYPCISGSCPCHSNSTQERNCVGHVDPNIPGTTLYSPCKICKTAPHHTSPEKETYCKHGDKDPECPECWPVSHAKEPMGISEDTYRESPEGTGISFTGIIEELTTMDRTYERNHSHYHCWDQDQPPACSIPLEKHEQCCLCDVKHNERADASPSTQNNQTYVEKTLEEFRDKFYSKTTGTIIVGVHLEECLEQWLSTKLEEARNRNGQRYIEGFENGEDTGRKAERTRILTLIESKKKEIHEVDSESFGWDLLNGQGPNTNSCCPGDDAAYAYELALTSLAAELQDR